MRHSTLVLAGCGDDGPARSIMPNAGLPQRTEGRFVYAAEPAYFGSMVPRMLDAGARILGGCCGTTPAHIAAMRAALDALDTQASRRERARAGRFRLHCRGHALPREQRGRRGRAAVTVRAA